MEPCIKKQETNLVVDLMLDLNFKQKLGELFTMLYKELVMTRELVAMSELGDFTCQIFTRTDVAQHLVVNFDLLTEIS